jgi:hypothetical protein
MQQRVVIGLSSLLFKFQINHSHNQNHNQKGGGGLGRRNELQEEVFR